MRGDELSALLRTLQMVHVKLDGQDFYFEEAVWQDHAMAARRLILESLTSAAGADGALNFDKDSDLGQFVSDFAAYNSLELGDKGGASLSANAMFSFSSGGRTLNLSIAANKGDSPARLSPCSKPSHPIKSHNAALASLKAKTVRPTNHFVFYTPGGPSPDRPAMVKLYHLALELVDRHFADFDRETALTKKGLIAKLLGFDPGSVTGKGLSALPAEYQNELLNMVGNPSAAGWQGYGFGSQDEAINFLRNATVSGAEPNLSVSIAAPPTPGGPTLFYDTKM